MRGAVLTCGFLLVVCLAAAQPQERCTVEGQVLKAGTGEPLKKARVVLRNVDERDVVYSTSTVESGRFVVTNVRPGRYRLSAERNGYLRVNYGQRRPNQAGTVLTLEPGRRVRDIVLDLIPFAVISGRVIDEDGEPMAHVRTMALRLSRERGRRELLPGAGAGTDDRGEYRIFGLAPGKYYVSATPVPSPGSISAEGDDEEYVQFFYPGVTDPAQAAPVELQAGIEMNGVDFRLARMRTVRVRGRVVAAAAGPKVERGIVVFLLPRGGMAAGPRNQNAIVDAQGNFEIRGVAPGSYLLTAFQSDRQRRFFARQPIDVGGSAIEGINLVLGPGLELSGRLRFEGGEGKLDGLRVLLESLHGNFGGGGGAAQVKPDGTFTFQNLAADEYRFSVLALAEDCYVKAARLGGGDVLESGVDLSRGDVPGALDVLLSAAGGRVEGTVLKDNQQPASGAAVVLVPDAQRRGRTDLFRSAAADDAGRFVLRGVPPGDYRLLAWEDVEPGAWLDPDFLREHERRGEPLSVGGRGKYTPQLRVIPAVGSAN
jgi:hypothetical protein